VPDDITPAEIAPCAQAQLGNGKAAFIQVDVGDEQSISNLKVKVEAFLGEVDPEVIVVSIYEIRKISEGIRNNGAQGSEPFCRFCGL
jgi:hypothetical protein